MEVAGGEVSGGNFKLRDDKSFLASLMPKTEIGADRFISSRPQFDGRGVVIAIFDTGVDPAADGLQVTSDGKPKILDVLDCTGSGDVDTSTVVRADANGCITGASGSTLAVNSSWKNPSGEWHVGYKFAYELFATDLVSRLKQERKEKWDQKTHEAIAEAEKKLDEFDKKHEKVDANLKKAREDLENRVCFLRKQKDNYDDKGPVIDAVVWHDGELWRVALDTQNFENDSESGKLADFTPLTNYREERKYGVFSKRDACTFVVNVYDEGNVLSIVTDNDPHGTHVAGICAAFHPTEPLLNGVAPGAQLISCKIGDPRIESLDSINTGTALTRAAITAVQHKCDLINMSYQTFTLLPDYGRFVDLVNEMVDKHRIVFVSIAGNHGPALSTLCAPGGTTSSSIGIGAYLSPSMAAGTHSLVEAPAEGLVYPSSSRGPTVDGDLGVSVSAPGAAVAPVPRWTLQHRMLMNGTSMAAPSACGGIALLINAMKAEGIPVSPYTIKEAIENTSAPVGDKAEDKLSAGHGLLQVDKAYEYIQKLHDVPCVSYGVHVVQVEKTTPVSRGIYLREASRCQQSTEWLVHLQPKFHEGASNLDQLVPFEECIELRSTAAAAVVRAPEHLSLTNNSSSFNIVVDPTTLSDGLHYYEVYGIDCKAPWRGPVFRVPITITKPTVLKNRPPLISFRGMSFLPGHIESRYIAVPIGATWLEATMNSSGFDTPRSFEVSTVQISPLRRPMMEQICVTYLSSSSKSFARQVEGGLTLEIAITQIFSSGIGSKKPTLVDVEINFHGIHTNKDQVVLEDEPVRIDAEALSSTEKLVPYAELNSARTKYHPMEAKITTLSSDRDKLPSGKQILALLLTYKFKLEVGSKIKPMIPVLNGRVHDSKFESQFYMISDSNKRVHATGDASPKYVQLPKGEYKLQVYVRHDNVQYLDKLRDLVLFIERQLEESLPLSFYEPDGPMMGNGRFEESTLYPGVRESFYVSPPAKDKVPKNCVEGTVLIGTISYGTTSLSDGWHPASYPVSYLVPPSEHFEDEGKGCSANSTKPASDHRVIKKVENAVRDAQLKVLVSLSQETDEERSEWIKLSKHLKSVYPKWTPLLSKILEGVLSSNNVQDEIHHFDEIIDAANEFFESIDKEELVRYLYFGSDAAQATRDQLTEALFQKGLALAEKETLTGKKDQEDNDDQVTRVDLILENLMELRKWVDLKSYYYSMLFGIQEKHNGRLGTALRVINGTIQREGESSEKRVYKLRISLLQELGWNHMAVYEKQWLLVRFPPSLPLF